MGARKARFSRRVAARERHSGTLNPGRFGPGRQVRAGCRVSLGMLISLGALLGACDRESGTASRVSPPGDPETAKTKTLEAGTVALQNKPPIEALNAYLDGF